MSEDVKTQILLKMSESRKANRELIHFLHKHELISDDDCESQIAQLDTGLFEIFKTIS